MAANTLALLFRLFLGGIVSVGALGVPAYAQAATISFVRGDANGDGSVDMSDAVSILDCQFAGRGCGGCLKASDVNGDHAVDISDATTLLNFLFRGAKRPPAPYPRCGVERTPGELACKTHAPCRSASGEDAPGARQPLVDLRQPDPPEKNASEVGELVAQGDVPTGKVKPRQQLRVKSLTEKWKQELRGYEGIVFQDGVRLRFGDGANCEERPIFVPSWDGGPWGGWHEFDAPRGGHAELHPYERKKLVYHSANELQPSVGGDIYVASPEAGHINLTKTPGINERHPSWSPDGTRIVFSVYSKDTADRGIWMMNADGSGRWRLADLPLCRDFAWSPDGTRIAFTYATRLKGVHFHSGPGSFSDIYIINADGTDLRPVTATELLGEYRPKWHPTEDMLVFERYDGHYELTPYGGEVGTPEEYLPGYEGQGPYETRIWISLAEGLQLQVTHAFPDWYSKPHRHDRLPFFTPDGHHIFFHTDRLGKGAAFVRIPIGGGPLQEIDNIANHFVDDIDHMHINWNFTNADLDCLPIQSSDSIPKDPGVKPVPSTLNVRSAR